MADDGLTAFLFRRIAEDEAIAREALHPDAVRPGEWVTEHHDDQDRCHIAEDRSGHYWTVAHDVFAANAEHMACHDPARVLLECAARRRIVEQFVIAEPFDLPADYREALTWTLRQLAAPFVTHPDYRGEWR